MLFSHGLVKLQSYSEKAQSFPDPLGVGSPLSMALAIFAEFFCSILLALGLFTRLAALNLAATMGVAAIIIHADDPFKEKELAVVYFFGFLAFILIGPGRFSLDRFIFRRTAASEEEQDSS